jgi:hypothetical protein
MANTVVLKRSAVQGKTPTTSDLALGELAVNTYDGNLFFKRDNGTASVVKVATNTNLLTYSRLTSNTTAVSRQAYIADTTGGAFTINLPSSPATGDWVVIGDGADFSTNNLYINRNSSSIEGVSENLTLDISGVSVTLVYDGTTWQVYTQVGATGGSGGGGGGSGTVTSITAGTGLSGGTITTSGTIAIDSTVATLTGTQTLTNKTLTTPRIATILTNSGAATITLPVATDTLVGRDTVDTLTNKTLTTPTISSITNSGTLTLPTGNQTLVGRTTTDTLTNKTLEFPVIASITNTGTLTLPTSTDTLVGRATTDTLTNKTISGADNTLSNIANSSLTYSSLTIGSTSVSLGATSTSLAGITELTVDNLNFNGNTIISTDTNGDITLTPNGTGKVTVSSDLAVNGGDITTSSTTATLYNSTATTVKIGEAATTVSIGDIGHSGTTTINNDLSVYGSITFSQGASSLSSTTIQIDDTLISLSDNNTADILDIGLYAGYRQSSTDYHTGLVRDASDSGVWKLFSNISAQPTNTVDFTSAVYDILQLSKVKYVGSSSGTTTLQAASAASGTLTLPAATDTLVGKATTDTLTNKTLSSAVVTGTLTASSTTGTSGQVLKSTGSGVEWGNVTVDADPAGTAIAMAIALG